MPLPLPYKVRDYQVQANFDALAGRFPFSRRDLQVEPAHDTGAAGEPAFLNAWVNFGAPWQGARFWKDGIGIIHIEGLVKTGVIGSAAFTLPAGYRPGLGLSFAQVTNTGLGQLNVLATGDVVPAIGGNTYFSLNCSFKQEA